MNRLQGRGRSPRSPSGGRCSRATRSASSNHRPGPIDRSGGRTSRPRPLSTQATSRSCSVPSTSRPRTPVAAARVRPGRVARRHRRRRGDHPGAAHRDRAGARPRDDRGRARDARAPGRRRAGGPWPGIPRAGPPSMAREAVSERTESFDPFEAMLGARADVHTATASRARGRQRTVPSRHSNASRRKAFGSAASNSSASHVANSRSTSCGQPDEQIARRRDEQRRSRPEQPVECLRHEDHGRRPSVA